MNELHGVGICDNKFVSKIILFQKVLQLKDVIMHCYSKQSLVRMTTSFPPPLTWHVCQILVHCLYPIVTTCVLNQSRGHWLLSDVLHFVISMNLKLKKTKKCNIFSYPNGRGFWCGTWVNCLASNIKFFFVEF
jgi:hypothetical protein